MNAQEWIPDVETVGTLMGTGSWQKTVEGNVELVGILTVLETAESAYELRFRVMRKGRSGNARLLTRRIRRYLRRDNGDNGV